MTLSLPHFLILGLLLFLCVSRFVYRLFPGFFFFFSLGVLHLQWVFLVTLFHLTALLSKSILISTKSFVKSFGFSTLFQIQFSTSHKTL